MAIKVGRPKPPQPPRFLRPCCPGISGTVTDFFTPSRIPDSFIIVPEVEERRTIKPLVARVLALLAVYGGIVR